MRLSNKQIEFHASPALYRDWCNLFKVSIRDYPYAVAEPIKVGGMPIPFAVWEYGFCRVDGHRVRQLYIIYKGIGSKHQFTKYIYI